MFKRLEKKGRILLAGFIVSNIFFAFFFWGLYFLSKCSYCSSSDLKKYYPKHYDIVYLFTCDILFFFIIWLILFLLVNGFFIYMYARHFNLVREVLLALIILVVTISSAEFILRKLKYVPGEHTKVRYFKKVDSLYFMDGFATDSIGIFKVDRSAGQRVAENIKSGKTGYDNTTQVPEIYSLSSESINIINGQSDCKFAGLFQSLSKRDTAGMSTLNKAILEYVRCPINEDGFRSIPFKPYSSEKPKVLLLGDSFTWGHSTRKKCNSFADELLAEGYTVYNTGISATDVAQYLAIAEHYIPVLKPDVVIVNFYLGNDITYYKREVKPFTPVFFSTNAGNLISFPFGKYFNTADEAYRFYLRRWKIPKENNLVNRVLAQTVITTLAWKALYKLGLVDNNSLDDRKFIEEEKKFDKPYCNVELKKIREIAGQNNARFILSSIPEVYSYTFNTKKDFPDLFEGLDYVEMKVEKDDYKLDDGHFNDAGHKKYAVFLDSIISAL